MSQEWLRVRVVEIGRNVPLRVGDEVFIPVQDIEVVVKDTQEKVSIRMRNGGTFRAEVLMLYGVFPWRLVTSDARAAGDIS